APDLILGQTSITGVTANPGGRSASTMSDPQGLAIDGTKLYVADWGNQRVLVFENINGLSNGAAATGLLGQTDVTGAGGGRGPRRGATRARASSAGRWTSRCIRRRSVSSSSTATTTGSWSTT